VTDDQQRRRWLSHRSLWAIPREAAGDAGHLRLGAAFRAVLAIRRI
jgi:hypothetical protein